MSYEVRILSRWASSNLPACSSSGTRWANSASIDEIALAIRSGPAV